MTTLKYLYYRLLLWLNPPKQIAKVKRLSNLPRSRKRWTEDEVSDLTHLYEFGASIPRIADELDRSEAGVRSKLISLGYSTKQ